MTKQSIQKGRGKPWSFAALNPQLFGSVMPVCKQPVATLALDSCPLGRTALLPTPSPRGLAPKTPKTLYTLYRTLFSATQSSVCLRRFLNFTLGTSVIWIPMAFSTLKMVSKRG